MTVEGYEPATTKSLARPLVWAFHMALPLIGLWLLVAQPDLDVKWLYQGAHFALVAAAALISTAVGLLVNEAARRRGDARLFLVGLVFVSSSGFLLMHALATPGIFLAQDNPGFEFGVSVGLALSGLFAALSAPRRPSPVFLRHGRAIRAALLLVMLAWGAATLLEVPPLAGRPTQAQVDALLWPLTVVGVPLFGYAAFRCFRDYQRRYSVVLLSVLTAHLLLAEALLAIPIGHLWHLSWWLWHLLMLLGFGYVAYSAHIQYRREGTSAGLFDGVGSEQTIARLRGEYGAALEALVTAMRRRESLDNPGLTEEIQLISAGLAARFGLTEGQTAVLGRAAEALAGERAQLAKLHTMVGIGQQASVILAERELLEQSLARITEGFVNHSVRIGLVTDGRLRFPANLSSQLTEPLPAEADACSRALGTRAPADDGAGGMALPLVVKGRPAGVLHLRRAWGRFDQRDTALLESLSAQLSVTLENARLYRQIDGLFRQYMSPDVATALIADPAQAALGGAQVEVTALFADLRGFTTFSERVTPGEIVELLNRYFAAATKEVLAEGGTVVQFVGDAMMALFNAPVRQPDHPARAARAALAMQDAIAALAADDPEAPRFRVGVNTGAALVGNIGGEQLRNFNAMGDAVNVAARLQTVAQPGTVVIGESTYRGLGEIPAEVTALGALALKGKQDEVRAFVLHSLGGRPA
ncbi:hypothetical protein GCM10023321_77100 [Pseudonocardia eucalypti]|uniref:Guanylate cyclase domain-containing protein n=1 Tax=Pseudonocardia eucalypti TaxID=648755 RepID=A0ABP9RAG8_9PSEU|nr:class 3 adenylate cyclase [Pseudonocardia eucalypti]